MSEVEAIFLTALIASVLAAWGIVTQRVITRRLTTLQHLSKQGADHDMIAARAKFNEISATDGKLALYSKPADLTDDETKQVRLVLNDYELCAIGIWHGIYDLKIIKLYHRGTILHDWSRAASFIYKLRSELDNPNIYFEFETLTHWLQDHRRPKRRIWTRLWF